MIRETEAVKKWCPFARQMVTIEDRGVPKQVGSANRFEKDRGSTCLGSTCMAWRSPNGVFGYCGLVGEDGR